MEQVAFIPWSGLTLEPLTLFRIFKIFIKFRRVEHFIWICYRDSWNQKISFIRIFFSNYPPFGNRLCQNVLSVFPFFFCKFFCAFCWLPSNEPLILLRIEWIIINLLVQMIWNKIIYMIILWLSVHVWARLSKYYHPIFDIFKAIYLFTGWLELTVEIIFTIYICIWTNIGSLQWMQFSAANHTTWTNKKLLYAFTIFYDVQCCSVDFRILYLSNARLQYPSEKFHQLKIATQVLC